VLGTGILSASPPGGFGGRPLERTSGTVMLPEPFGVSPGRPGSKRAEWKRGAGIAEGLRLRPISGSRSAHHESGSRPWEAGPVGASRRRKSLRGEPPGSRGQRSPRNALERRNPRGAASVRTANPRARVTDSGGEQGPEVESAVRPHVASATGTECGQRQEGSGRREASRLRPEGEASKGRTPGALPTLTGRKDAGDETRQEGAKPCSRTRTGTRQIPGEWVPASACAEGAGTPGRRRAREGFGKPARSYSEGEANPRRGGARMS
jgi:hypothetical protein